MDSAFKLPIHIYYRPPAWILPLLGFSHAGAIICVFSVAVPALAQWLTFILLLASLIRHMHETTRSREPGTGIQLFIDSQDKWWIIDAHSAIQGQLLPAALVHPALVIVRVKLPDRIHALILTNGNVNADTLRRLRVRLRYPMRC